MSRSHDCPATLLTFAAGSPSVNRASTGTVAGSVLATGSGGATGRIGRTCVLLRAPGPTAVAALTGTAAERTTDLRRSSQVVFAVSAVTVRVAAAANAWRLLRNQFTDGSPPSQHPTPPAARPPGSGAMPVAPRWPRPTGPIGWRRSRSSAAGRWLRVRRHPLAGRESRWCGGDLCRRGAQHAQNVLL